MPWRLMCACTWGSVLGRIRFLCPLRRQARCSSSGALYSLSCFLQSSLVQSFCSLCASGRLCVLKESVLGRPGQSRTFKIYGFRSVVPCRDPCPVNFHAEVVKLSKSLQKLSTHMSFTHVYIVLKNNCTPAAFFPHCQVISGLCNCRRNFLSR